MGGQGERGFTLVELLTYLGLFTTMAVTIVGAETFARRMNLCDVAMIQVLQDGDRTLARLRDDARAARFYEGPTEENGKAAAVFHLPAIDREGKALEVDDRAVWRLVPAASGSGSSELWRFSIPAERSARPAYKELLARDVADFRIERASGTGPTLLEAELDVAYARGSEQLFARSLKEKVWLRAER